MPITMIAGPVLAWVAYTVLIPSAPPPGDMDAGARLGEPREDAMAGATPGVGSVLSPEANSRESGGMDQQPSSDSPNVDSGEAPAKSSEGGTSPEEAALRTAWRTADGKLYFGIAPPPGSVKIESFGKPGATKTTPPPPPR